MGRKYETINTDNSDMPKSRPAMTPEARENQLINLAYDLVEQRLRNGTASSQETTHFLKMGSEREKLERERIRSENELAMAKIENMQSQEKSEELYRNAIEAFKSYAGVGAGNGSDPQNPGGNC